MGSVRRQTREDEFFARTPEFEPLKGLRNPESDICYSTYSSDLLSYTNGSHEGFVEFCVIEVF